MKVALEIRMNESKRLIKKKQKKMIGRPRKNQNFKSFQMSLYLTFPPTPIINKKKKKLTRDRKAPSRENEEGFLWVTHPPSSSNDYIKTGTRAPPPSPKAYQNFPFWFLRLTTSSAHFIKWVNGTSNLLFPINQNPINQVPKGSKS